MIEPELHVVTSVARAGAELFAACARESVAERGRFAVVLSGGGTPLAMYDLLRADYGNTLPWADTLFFWGDERFVPYSHADSNFGAAKTRLLDGLPALQSNIHPWPYVPDRPEVAAAAYAQIITDRLGSPPSFDLVLLGLGGDAHTASLFPGDGALAATGLTAVTEPASQATRMTLTAQTLSQGRVVAFLVAGEGKRRALESTLYSERDPRRYPAQAISARERLVWLTDQDVVKREQP
jgi:6-phosphogluconolactonase